MVVTARASNRKPHHRGRQNLELVGYNGHPLGDESLRNAVRAVRTHSQEACCDEFVAILGVERQRLSLVIEQFVAGDLFRKELVVWLVRVEGTNHPVPVAPGMRAHRVEVDLALRVRVSRRIQPASPPVLAVAIRLEQSVHKPFVGIGTLVR